MAAYACTLPSMPPDPVEMAEDCGQMGMERVQEAPALCAEHCSPDPGIATDGAAPQVPPLALPPLQFAAVIVLPFDHAALCADLPMDRPSPPVRLRYCSLLI